MDGEYVIDIPIYDSNEFISIKQEELLEDAQSILGILRKEFAPLNVWIAIAKAYYRRDLKDQFVLLLQETLSQDLEELFEHDEASRCEIANLLGSFYAAEWKRYDSQVDQHQDVRMKNECRHLADSCFTKSESIDGSNVQVMVGRGHFLLASGELDAALLKFENALEIDPLNYGALIGKIRILFAKALYGEALSILKFLMRKLRTVVPEIRVAMGYCYFRLEDMPTARACFQRALSLDERNVDALVGIIICDLGSGDIEKMKRAVRLLEAAYELNNENALVCVHRASNHFYRQEFEKVHSLAMNAFKNAPTRYSGEELEHVRAEATFLIGRCFHIRGDLNSAFNYYEQSVKKWPTHALALFSFSKILIYRGELGKAAENLTRCAELAPNSIDVRRLLAMVLSRQIVGLFRRMSAGEAIPRHLPKIANSIDLINAIPSHKRDLMLYLTRSELRCMTLLFKGIEKDILRKALEDLEESQKLLTVMKNGENQAETKYENAERVLEHNIGTVAQLIGDHELAERSYIRSLRKMNVAEGENTQEKVSPSSIIGLEGGDIDLNTIRTAHTTTLFNLARLLGDTNRESEAIDILLWMVKKNPVYAGPWVALAKIIERQTGTKAKASWLSYALESLRQWKPGEQDILSMLGATLMDAMEWNKAHEIFDKILNESGGEGESEESSDGNLKGKSKGKSLRADYYALLSLGNLCLHNVNPSLDKSKRRKLLEKAQKYYDMVLTKDISNIYAAHGLVCVLAQKEKYIEARDILLQLLEVSGSGNRVFLTNLGHIYYYEGQFGSAARIYENILRMAQTDSRGAVGMDGDVMLYLASAYFEEEKFKEASAVLRKAVFAYPWEIPLQFNLAVCEYKEARKRYSSGDLRAAEAEKLSDELSHALLVFKTFSTMYGGKTGENEAESKSKFVISSNRASLRVVFDLRQNERLRQLTQNLLGDMVAKLEEVVQFEESEESKVREWQEKAEAAKAKVRQKHEAIESVKLMKIKEEQEVALKRKRELETMKRVWKQTGVGEMKEKVRKKAQETLEVPSGDSDGGSDEDGIWQPKGKRRKARQ